ncbi:MAG: G5 domain-containing protein [Oscillospiraceae bacterium]|nr:G5 domain-containing protein [Oscillospiraceae bacterium]
MKKLLQNIARALKGHLPAAGILLAAAVLIPLSIQEVKPVRYTYLLQEQHSAAPTAIFGTPEEDADYKLLHVRADSKTLGDAQLVLEKGQTVTVTANGETKTVTARHETVENLLRRLHIKPGERDMVALDMTGETLKISVTDYWLYSWEKTVETGYSTERVEDPLLYKGTEKVVQEGQNGSYVETYLDLYMDGELRQTSFINRTDDTSVAEVVACGTRVDSVSRDDRISEDHPDGTGGGYLTFASGETLSYSKVMICSATAYAIHGYGATGYPTQVGNIAVDPKVIPYGTRMYIQTTNGSWVYGMAVARDCGSAVKGNIIDLWFEDLATCYRWGRRNCTVYILN